VNIPPKTPLTREFTGCPCSKYRHDSDTPRWSETHRTGIQLSSWNGFLPFLAAKYPIRRQVIEFGTIRPGCFVILFFSHSFVCFNGGLDPHCMARGFFWKGMPFSAVVVFFLFKNLVFLSYTVYWPFVCHPDRRFVFMVNVFIYCWVFFRKRITVFCHRVGGKN